MIRKIILHTKKIPVNHAKCVGCGREDNKAFFYEGTIVTGVAFKTLEGLKRMPIKLWIETYDKLYIVGGENIKTERKVAFLTRKRGPICTFCAENYHTVEFNGEKVPIVKTKARPGWIGETIMPAFDREKVSYEDTAIHSVAPAVVPGRTFPARDHQENHWLNVGRKR